MTGLDEVEEGRNVAWILDLACRNESMARGVEKLWTSRVCAEVRADLAYAHTKCHPSLHTHLDRHIIHKTTKTIQCPLPLRSTWHSHCSTLPVIPLVILAALNRISFLKSKAVSIHFLVTSLHDLHFLVTWRPLNALKPRFQCSALNHFAFPSLLVKHFLEWVFTIDNA